MPLVAHSSLPSFADLSSAGEQVLDLETARHQDIRELHIGLLNMMPDAALKVTEQQFMRLIGGANPIVQIYVHLFTVPGIERSAAARAHIDAHYTPFETLQRDGLDALVISGANVSNPDLADEPFWEPLGQVMDWAQERVTSVLCSCLASHALIQRFHGIHRRRMLNKRWGVYGHRVVAPDHPLMRGTNTRFDAPHSRWNTLSPSLLREAGLRVLVETLDGGMHVATSPDGFRVIYLQGHPEYDTISLLKEYKRELARYLAGETEGSPPHPQYYYDTTAAVMINEHLEAALAARRRGTGIPPFPEADIASRLDNTWTDTGKAMFNNWLGLVYRTTDLRRGVPFMDGVDPDDPLGLRTPAPA